MRLRGGRAPFADASHHALFHPVIDPINKFQIKRQAPKADGFEFPGPFSSSGSQSCKTLGPLG
jgi:hypothetical protein